MDGCIFGLGYLLWLAIKGICKLLWLIISFPFKLIKNSRVKKKRKIEQIHEMNERNKIEQQERQTVENLFQKIKKDIFVNYNGNDLPTKVIIYVDRIELVYGTGQTKVLNYANYGTERFRHHTSYWCTDGSTSVVTTNQLMLLAKRINEAAKDVYFLNDKCKESISNISTEITMHHYYQECVEMHKK